ncbi:MAG: hypothetical protein WBP64_11770 [Nitrososphaeraceae archaeon]
MGKPFQEIGGSNTYIIDSYNKVIRDEAGCIWYDIRYSRHNGDEENKN